ncbi:lysoplasmalogenase TMEM86A-like [Branchiostoma lanceolatum]|uniref:lysoplasmalogenase TMEM86A-like n=1 Tax=Branchiostoma lanceolatum TaxID=7740 RepID=UPI00345192C3
MDSPVAVLKSVGPKLVPFFKTTCIYYILWLDADKPTLFSALIKCLPVLSLCVFVLLHGMSLSDMHTYARRILGGLVFSALGDAFLIWQHIDGIYFIYGMVMFAIAHVLYIVSFGFRPLRLPVGAALFGVAAGMYAVLYPGLHGVYSVLVGVYVLLLWLMLWRGMARLQVRNDLWTWTKLCACVGALLFIISDTLLGVNKFRIPIPYNRALIMTTYYAAQLGIALSVADLKDPASGDVTTCGAPDVTASSNDVHCSNNEDVFELKDMSAHSFSNGLCCAKKME